MVDEQSEPNTAQNEPQTPQAAQPQPQPESQPQAPPQEPQPQIVIPPAQPQAPPANAQEVIARQQEALAQQQAWAQARDRNQFGPVAEGIQGQAAAPMMGGALQQAAAQQQQQPPPAQGVNLPGGLSAVQVAQGNQQQQLVQQPQPQPQQQQPQIQIQPQPQIALNPMVGGLRGLPDPAVPQGGHEDIGAALIAAGLPDPSIPQDGVTVAQLKQNAHVVQGAPQPSYGYPPGQQPQHQQQQPTSKPSVRWYPGRNSKTVIEFQDSILTGLPDGVEQEPDPQAKVVAVLLMEILALRERAENLEQMMMQGGGGGALEARVQVLERTLFEQTKSLQQGAQAFREEQVRLAAEQNVAAADPTE